MDAPADAVADGSANTLHIADTSNNRIRKVAIGGNISTIVGTGTNTSTGDNGPMYGATLMSPGGVTEVGNGNLYVSDYAPPNVRKILGPA
jgi:hypothetical protein